MEAIDHALEIFENQSVIGGSGVGERYVVRRGGERSGQNQTVCSADQRQAPYICQSNQRRARLGAGGTDGRTGGGALQGRVLPLRRRGRVLRLQQFQGLDVCGV